MTPGGLLLLVTLAAGAVYVLLVSEGEPYVTGALMFVLLIVVLTFYRLVWGLFLFIGMSVFFDQWSEFESSFTSLARYFYTLNTFPRIQEVGIGVLTPMELHLLFLVAAWLMLGVLRRDLHITPPPFAPLLLLLIAWMTGSVIRGRMNGADLLMALWDTRGIAVFALVLFLVPQVVRTREEVASLLWVLILTTAFKALQGVVRYVDLGFSFGHWPKLYETLTNNHEDAIFLVNLFVFMLALGMFGALHRQRHVLLALLPLSLLGFVAANRRAAIAALGAALLAMLPFVPASKRRRVLVRTAWGLAAFALYLGLFWNNTGRPGVIAQQVKATIISDPTVTGERNFSSDLARKIENYNLATTTRRHPVAGIGFGTPWEVSIQFWEAKNVGLTHNGILALLVKTGAIGFFLFWLYFNLYLMHTARVVSEIRDAYLRAVCLLAIVSVITHLVFSYVDTGLNYTRSMTWIALFMGIVPVALNIHRLEAQR